AKAFSTSLETISGVASGIRIIGGAGWKNLGYKYLFHVSPPSGSGSGSSPVVPQTTTGSRQLGWLQTKRHVKRSVVMSGSQYPSSLESLKSLDALVSRI